MAKTNFKGAARELGVSVPKVRQLVREREVPHYRIGRRVVFETEELSRWLQLHRVSR